MLKIWGRRSSANVQKVLWLAAELSLPHEQISVGGKFGGLGDPSFRAMNPHGRIPVIEDDGVVVWESHAILRYLAARHGGAAFWPEAPAARALTDQWMDWSQSRFQPDFLDGVFWTFYRTPEAQRNWTAINDGLRRTGQNVALVDSVLAEQPYLGGDTLSLADIAFATLLYRYFELDIERPSAPNVEAYYARMKARPAYRENAMVPFDELKGRLA